MSERTIDTNAKTINAKLNVPELLAPVGGREQLVVAVNNGADAVYMGGSLFNARMKAENFGLGKGTAFDLKEAIDYAHSWGVKVYITLNTLIKDRELPKAFEYACSLYEMGADAVILQDLGLAGLIHKYLPDFPMHLSTQGTVYNRSGVEMARELGFCRVVPARECSLKEIGSMCAAPVEIEVFIHGALCMCYSGQCQMSRLLGGGSARSGNRGLCAQPCRLGYRDDRGQLSYALSPRDICTIDSLPALAEAGVRSLKIEGRLKSPEYVAVVTRIYRKYLDLYAKAGSYVVDEADRRMLLQIFNRGGFTEGYLYGNPGESILSGESPKHQGIPVGKVLGKVPVKTGKGSRETGKKGRSRDADKRWLVDVKLFTGESVSMGDGVELSACGNVVTYLEKRGSDILRIGDFKTAGKGGDLEISTGELVYKVTDRTLLEEALAKPPARKNRVDMTFIGEVGVPAKLKLFDGDKVYEVKADGPVEKALKRPADPARIREQLEKLGDTPFEAGKVEIKVDKDAMAPVSVINSLRRQGANLALSGRCYNRIAVGEDVRAEAFLDIEAAAAGFGIAPQHATSPQYGISSHNATPLQQGTAPEGWSSVAQEREPAFVRDCILVPLEVFMEKCSGGADEKLNVQGDMIPYLLNVSKGSLDEYVDAHFDEIVEAVKSRGIALGNLGWIREFHKAGVKVYGDYGLNVYNSYGAAVLAGLGVDVIEWSDELLGEGAKSLIQRRCRRVPEIMERIPLMITEHPLESDYLIDRKGVKHDVFKWYSGDKFLIF